MAQRLGCRILILRALSRQSTPHCDEDGAYGSEMARDPGPVEERGAGANDRCISDSFESLVYSSSSHIGLTKNHDGLIAKSRSLDKHGIRPFTVTAGSCAAVSPITTLSPGQSKTR